MFVSNESLQKFSQSVPFCLETEPLEAVRSILISGNFDVVVVVDRDRFPKGSIYLHGLLPYMLNNEKHYRKRVNTKSTPSPQTPFLDWQKPLNLLEAPLVSALKILPAQ
ncbi:MAG: hypothetical protein F6K35_09625, partial [Okeania sp. SIO2H7]|nr:hypothetical protein [Okeania sp. SIO2H7]